jgi:TetR/AcrR family transcriptional repressor of nem operon
MIIQSFIIHKPLASSSVDGFIILDRSFQNCYSVGAVGRPRQFDRERALERAMETFWVRGYERTSVRDLVERMGIQRGSLYAAFGDKRHLFLEALERYETRFHEDMEHLLATPPAREGIRRIFERVLSDCACDDGSKGCLMTNTAVALAEDDAEIAERVRANLGRLEGAFTAALERARERGELAGGRPPRSLARFLTNALQGLRVLSKCRVDLGVLQDTVETTLSVLDETAPLPEHHLERRFS